MKQKQPTKLIIPYIHSCLEYTLNSLTKTAFQKMIGVNVQKWLGKLSFHVERTHIFQVLIITSWWFQPIRKILVKLEIFPD